MVQFGDLLAALTVLALGGAWLWRHWSRPVPVEPLREAERERLARWLPIVATLTPTQRERHAAQVAQFLADKQFYGCNGLDVSPDMALAIAGTACLLTVRRQGPPYPALRSVLVYPDAFRVRDPEPDELGLVFDEGVELSGESWDGQRIIVSWADVEAALDGDPVNVVAHECAHQLDDEAPQAEGAPLLADYDEWSRIMQAEYDRLCEHGSPVIDDYGCESPAEFFAVCVESYLQRGAELAHHHPALYGLLCSHFQLNTAHLDEH